MSAQAHEVDVDQLPILEPKDLKHFDKEAVDLVLEYQAHGWTGWISANRHVILRAPDGDGTASIGRKWRSKRSSEISRQKLDQWLRRKQREREERERADAFGRLPFSDPDHVKTSSPEPPWQMARKQSYDARLRMQKITRDWWKEVQDAGSGNTVWGLRERGPDNWVLVSGPRADEIYQLVAVGPEADPALVEEATALIEANNRKGNELMNKTGPQVKAHPCEEPACEASFDTQGALNLHKQVHVKFKKTCPLCDRPVHTPAAFGRHIRSAIHASDPRLPGILEALSMGPVKPKQMRTCEYGCGLELSGYQIGGHHRAHQRAGHVKVADGGDGATQVFTKAKATTAAPKASKAVTEAPVKPEPLAVAALPAPVEKVAVNGSGQPESAEDVLNLVRTLVNPELAGENERLRARCERLEADLAAKTAAYDEAQARLEIVKEAMNA